MRNLLWRRRILPLTMVGMVFVLTQRAADLARTAVAKDIPVAQPAAKTVSVPNAPIAAQPGATSAGTPPSPSSEYRLLAELRQKREELDRREARLDAEGEVAAAVEARLRTRLDELGTLQSKLEDLKRRQQQQDQDRWQGLVKVYAEMKPRDAAAIFDLLDPQTMTDVLDRMDDRRASAILAAMMPERARLATQLLARKRATGSETDRGESPLPPTAVATGS